MANVHIHMQGKGGVGKSLTAYLTAQYFIDEGAEQYFETPKSDVQCFDCDPENQTLKNYSGLNVKYINILEGQKDINRIHFDEMINEILEKSKDNYIIDIGASSYVPFFSYLVEGNIFDIFKNNGLDIWLHTVIVGGEGEEDTIKSAKEILNHDSLNPTAKVVWMNNYFGKFKKHKENEFDDVEYIVLSKPPSDTYGHDLEMIQKEHLLLSQIKFDDNLKKSLLTCSRIEQYFGSAWNGLDKIEIKLNGEG